MENKAEKSMDKKYVIGSVALSLLFGIVIGVMCSGCGSKNKVAIVDIASVVSKSAQVQALKEDQNVKAQELNLWLQSAQEAVKNEKDKSKQEELLKQYNAEYAQKREAISNDYAQKIQAIDKDITQTISEEAKKKGFQLVVSKEFTIYGEYDITKEIEAVIK